MDLLPILIKEREIECTKSVAECAERSIRSLSPNDQRTLN